ncbi:hypothetical protein AB6A40_005847 [Gnathostoma spinigerum]|uniref:SET domain-containing protein n=1 Tax=Gnathostoma spinigerum TaxID=75299 RepID=A0ABD6EQ60_9BILA
MTSALSSEASHSKNGFDDCRTSLHPHMNASPDIMSTSSSSRVSVAGGQHTDGVISVGGFKERITSSSAKETKHNEPIEPFIITDVPDMTTVIIDEDEDNNKNGSASPPYGLPYQDHNYGGPYESSAVRNLCENNEPFPVIGGLATYIGEESHDSVDSHGSHATSLNHPLVCSYEPAISCNRVNLYPFGRKTMFRQSQPNVTYRHNIRELQTVAASRGSVDSPPSTKKFDRASRIGVVTFSTPLSLKSTTARPISCIMPSYAAGFTASLIADPMRKAHDKAPAPFIVPSRGTRPILRSKGVPCQGQSRESFEPGSIRDGSSQASLHQQSTASYKEEQDSQRSIKINRPSVNSRMSPVSKSCFFLAEPVEPSRLPPITGGFQPKPFSAADDCSDISLISKRISDSNFGTHELETVQVSPHLKTEPELSNISKENECKSVDNVNGVIDCEGVQNFIQTDGAVSRTFNDNPTRPGSPRLENVTGASSLNNALPLSVGVPHTDRLVHNVDNIENVQKSDCTYQLELEISQPRVSNKQQLTFVPGEACDDQRTCQSVVLDETSELSGKPRSSYDLELESSNDSQCWKLGISPILSSGRDLIRVPSRNAPATVRYSPLENQNLPVLFRGGTNISRSSKIIHESRLTTDSNGDRKLSLPAPLETVAVSESPSQIPVCPAVSPVSIPSPTVLDYHRSGDNPELTSATSFEQIARAISPCSCSYKPGPSESSDISHFMEHTNKAKVSESIYRNGQQNADGFETRDNEENKKFFEESKLRRGPGRPRKNLDVKKRGPPSPKKMNELREGEGEPKDSAFSKEEWTEEYTTRCYCDLDHEDVEMISCDVCNVWQHMKCMGINPRRVPKEYKCELCLPRKLRLTKAQARKIQLKLIRKRRKEKERKKLAKVAGVRRRGNKEGGNDIVDAKNSAKRGVRSNDFMETNNNEYSQTVVSYARRIEEGSREMVDAVMNNDGVSVMFVAQDQKGLVSMRTFREGDPVMYACGRITLQSECRGRSRLGSVLPFVAVYSELRVDNNDESTCICIDARRFGSCFRYARRSCRPNTKLQHVVVDGKLHFIGVATEDIERGDEVTLPFDSDYQMGASKLKCACSFYEGECGVQCPVEVFNRKVDRLSETRSSSTAFKKVMKAGRPRKKTDGVVPSKMSTTSGRAKGMQKTHGRGRPKAASVARSDTARCPSVTLHASLCCKIESSDAQFFDDIDDVAHTHVDRVNPRSEETRQSGCEDCKSSDATVRKKIGKDEVRPQLLSKGVIDDRSYGVSGTSRDEVGVNPGDRYLEDVVEKMMVPVISTANASHSERALPTDEGSLKDERKESDDSVSQTGDAECKEKLDEVDEKHNNTQKNSKNVKISAVPGVSGSSSIKRHHHSREVTMEPEKMNYMLPGDRNKKLTREERKLRQEVALIERIQAVQRRREKRLHSKERRYGRVPGFCLDGAHEVKICGMSSETPSTSSSNVTDDSRKRVVSESCGLSVAVKPKRGRPCKVTSQQSKISTDDQKENLTSSPQTVPARRTSGENAVSNIPSSGDDIRPTEFEARVKLNKIVAAPESSNTLDVPLSADTDRTAWLSRRTYQAGSSCGATISPDVFQSQQLNTSQPVVGDISQLTEACHSELLATPEKHLRLKSGDVLTHEDAAILLSQLSSDALNFPVHCGIRDHMRQLAALALSMGPSSFSLAYVSPNDEALSLSKEVCGPRKVKKMSLDEYKRRKAVIHAKSIRERFVL